MFVALLTAALAWVSFGTVAFSSGSGTRLGLLPLSLLPIAAALILAGVAALLVRNGAPRSPLLLLVVILLPWLPVSVPSAFLIWSGPLLALVWMAVLMLMAGGLPARLPVLARLADAADAGRSTVAAAMLALVVFASSGWWVAPRLPTGDEPHYLVITQSLLLDRDLKIANNHQRGDYRAYYPYDLSPHSGRRDRNRAVYSIHAPGLPGLVLPAFAVAGHAGVMAFLVLAAAAGSGLAWHLAWRATGRRAAAWFGWAVVTLPVTAVFYSFSVYPDGLGGVLVLTGIWALMRADAERTHRSGCVRPWLAHGASLALLPWLHSRFAVLAGMLSLLLVLRLASTTSALKKTAAFVTVPVMSAVLWVGFFVAVYGTADPWAPYGRGKLGAWQWVPGGLAGLLFDQRFGLLAYAPVVFFAFVGVGMMLADRRSRRLGVELLAIVCPYLIIVTHFAMWWGGYVPPARFFVPVLALFAVPAATFWARTGPGAARAAALASLVFTVFATVAVVCVERGRLAYNTRDTPALWLDWLSPGSDLTHALPAWMRTPDTPLFRDIGIWASSLALGFLVARALARRGAFSGAGIQVIVGAALAASAMLAATVTWRARGSDGRDVVSAQWQLLREVARTPRGLGIDFRGPLLIAPASLPRRMSIETATTSTARDADSTYLMEIPALPAGEYRVVPVGDNLAGWLVAGIGHQLQAPASSGPPTLHPQALATAELSSHPQPMALRLPVSARGLVVRGDERAQRTVRALRLEPVRVMPPGAWGGEVALGSMRYEDVTAFFLNESAFAEPGGFWVGGGGHASVVFQPDDGRPSLELVVRNGPATNRIHVEASGVATTFQLPRNGERRIRVAVDPSRNAAHVSIRSDGGFTPAAIDANADDKRYLGVWVRVASAGAG